MTRRLFVIVLLLLTMAVLSSFAQKSETYDLREKNVRGSVPQYQIFNIGVVNSGDSASQGLGVSDGGIAVGRSLGSGSDAFTWSNGIGTVGLPRLSGRTFCLSAGANDIGFVVGSCSSSFTGTGRLPVIWQNGVVSQLPLPSGESIGDANDINASGVSVGSVNGGSLQRGVIYSNGTASVITQTTPNGSFFVTAFKINDSGRVIGQGIDPTNAARNVGIVYDIGNSTAFEVGALTNANGALAFGLSNNGYVVGSSMMNQGSGQPFIWSQSNGMVAIPLPVGTSQGSARGVNSSGWAVGTASSAFAIPFLYDGTNTYRLADLIPAGTGWDLSTNTSSSALGISDDGIIVGTGVINGQIRAYAMVPVSNVSVSGRVLDLSGSPIRNAFVTISGPGIPSEIRFQTGTFGRFNFEDLQTGVEYTISVHAGRNTFSPSTRTVTPQSNVSNLDFTAEQ